MKSSLSTVLTVLVSTFIGVVYASLSKALLYPAPDECRWVEPAEHDVTLVCKLKTINSELEKTNFSVIQPHNTKRLKLECNDGLFFQSSLSAGSFQPLHELQSLWIEYCKIGNLTDGSFQGLKQLQNLTLRTHNDNWSSMNLNIAPYVFSESMVSLIRLDLSHNNMWSVPDGMICPLNKLEYLNLTKNRLRDLSAFHFTASLSVRLSKNCGSALKILDLSSNSLDNLSPAIFSGLGKLQHLLVNKNALNFIADRALQGLISLERFDGSENRLNSLPPELFSETRNIKEIYLQNNSINVLAPGLFAELAQLTVLDISRNQLSSEWINSATFKGLYRLLQLDLSYNKISKIESLIFKDLKHLQVLRIQENFIETIADNTFGELENLHSLVLSNNRLVTIEANALRGLKNLVLLSLDYNRIANIDSSSLQNCTSLQDLHLNGNKLTVVPNALYHVPFLKTLDLGENQIVSIDDASFRNMTQMYGLRLTENQIKHIKQGTFDKMKAIQILNLSQNKVVKIDAGSFDNNRNLQAIRLDGNFLSDITGLFTKLPSLVWLNISDNHLESFDYALIPTGLQWLDIHANKIKALGNYFEIESKLSLTTFDASSNLLSEITGNAIPNSIEMLYLNDNLISKVQSYTFFKKPNLTRVDMFGNKITTLDQNALRISAVAEDKPLPEFHIGGNPFQCDCQLDWLQKNPTDTRTQPKLMDLESIYCHLLYNRGKTYVPLVEISAQQFLCKYEAHCFPLCHCCDFSACDCKMECPDQCTCYHDQSWQTNVVDCSRANYVDKLPDQIPIDATQIYLDGNRFKELASHSFIGRKKLKILFLNHSNIEVLHNRTFHGLRDLEVLQLNHNRLTALSGYEFHGLENLRELNLQSNRLVSIQNHTFIHFRDLRILRLDNNLLTGYNFWSLPNYLTELRLAGNPWSCECENVEKFRDYIQTYDFIKDKMKIKCTFSLGSNSTNVDLIATSNDKSTKSDGFLIYLANSTTMCNGRRRVSHTGVNVSTKLTAATATNDGNGSNKKKYDGYGEGNNGNDDDNDVDDDIDNITNGNLTSKKTFLSPHQIENYIPFLVAAICCFIVIIILTLLLIMFRQEMRVWFHSRFGIRLFYHNTDLDKAERDKVFDAFVSYSSKDETFVAEELVPLLEGGDPAYKLCVHYRDFPVGGYIADTIVHAVESSRRTIMVLSENFIKSEWCRFEFKSAHHQVLRDRRRRLIVIVLGDVPQKDIDPDISLYLKTNTYLQWGDKLFWQKLRYALPDVPNNRRQQPGQSINMTTNYHSQHPLNRYQQRPQAQQNNNRNHNPNILLQPPQHNVVASPRSSVGIQL